MIRFVAVGEEELMELLDAMLSASLAELGRVPWVPEMWGSDLSGPFDVRYFALHRFRSGRELFQGEPVSQQIGAMAAQNGAVLLAVMELSEGPKVRIVHLCQGQGMVLLARELERLDFHYTEASGAPRELLLASDEGGGTVGWLVKEEGLRRFHVSFPIGARSEGAEGFSSESYEGFLTSMEPSRRESFGHLGS